MIQYEGSFNHPEFNLFKKETKFRSFFSDTNVNFFGLHFH